MLNESVFKGKSDRNYYEALKLYYKGKFDASAKMLDQLMATMPYEAAYDVKVKANKLNRESYQKFVFTWDYDNDYQLILILLHS